MRNSSKRRRMTEHNTRKLQLVTEENIPFNYVEAYKSVRTNLKFISAASDAKSFVITSALTMEGKSNFAINLAATLAEEKKKVIIIDGDLRKPVIHKMLNLETEGNGLSRLLSGEIQLRDALVTVPNLNVDVLPVGVIPPNPTELLSQKRMNALLDALRNGYDYIIIDAPPISVVTDAAIIGGMVDGALLVVRSDYAPVETIRLAKERLDALSIKIFGVILSRYDVRKAGRQGYYSYKGRYYEYGYGYGYGYGNEEY